MCCIWIFIGCSSDGWHTRKFKLENPDHPDNEEELMKLVMKSMNFSTYVDAWMDIVITVT